MTNDQIKGLLLTLVAAAGTLVGTLVPHWGEQSKIVVGVIGTVVTVLLPVVHAQHGRSDAIAASPPPITVNPIEAPVPIVTPHVVDVAAVARKQAQEQVAGIDFNAIVREQLAGAFNPQTLAPDTPSNVRSNVATSDPVPKPRVRKRS